MVDRERHRTVAAPKGRRNGAPPELRVAHFAQIESANIRFGDLTVLVGPQATGKSLLLQWLKVAIDSGEVVHALQEAGHDTSTVENLIDLIFGEGMSSAWVEGKTAVSFGGRRLHPRAWTRGVKKAGGAVFFVPAHRALLLAEGWPAPFSKLNADTPVVARLFSQNLYQRFSGQQSKALFPVERTLKEQYRDLIDQAVFHGAQIALEKEGLRYRLRLHYKTGAKLPFMTWTAGQREFTPLLLGLYHVLPARKEKKRADIDWVIVEEPEMGLHPHAIEVFMLLVLDLLWRGYRVVLSTHSPLVLEVIWGIRQLSKIGAPWQSLCDSFGVRGSKAVKLVMEHALKADYRVYFHDIDNRTGHVTTRDISALDPDSPAESEADWGGLTRFSSRVGAAVRDAVNKAEEL